MHAKNRCKLGFVLVYKPGALGGDAKHSGIFYCAYSTKNRCNNLCLFFEEQVQKWGLFLQK